MGKRGKNVTEQKRAKVLQLLEYYSVDYVASNQNISSSEVRKIKRAARRKEEQKQLEEAQALFKAQFCAPAPETVVIDDFGGPGHHTFHFRQDIFKVISKNLGYDTSEFRVIRTGTPSGDLKIDVVVSSLGTPELFCPVEEHPLFPKLLSSLSETREQFTAWKKDGGQYLAMCSDIRREIHTEVSKKTPQSIYETATQFLPGILKPLVLPPSPLTLNFGDLIYKLAILHCLSPSQFPIPDRALYQIRPRNPFFSELYLGLIHLASAPEPPPIPPPPLNIILDNYANIHRDMIRKWSVSQSIIELLELFKRLREIEAVINEELVIYRE